MIGDSFGDIAEDQKCKFYDEISCSFMKKHSEEYERIMFGDFVMEEFLPQRIVSQYSKLHPEVFHKLFDSYADPKSDEVLKGALNTNLDGSINSKNRLEKIGDSFVDLSEDQKCKIYDEICKFFKNKHPQEYQMLVFAEPDVEECLPQLVVSQYSKLYPEEFHKLIDKYANSESEEI